MKKGIHLGLTADRKTLQSTARKVEKASVVNGAWNNVGKSMGRVISNPTTTRQQTQTRDR